MDFAVVVVGAGTAGMPCAITLAELGVGVTVIEKADNVGGALHLSAGQMSGAGSRLQRSKGIEDSPQHHLDDITRLGHGKADPAIARLAVEEAGASIDWLEELGFPFPDDQPIIYYGHDPYSRPRTYWGSELGISVLNTMQPRFDELVADGKIDLRLGHRLTDLLVDDGCVVGVRAETAAGSVELRADAVVLTTGGYAANREFFDRLHPGLHVLLGARETSQGEGLLAAQRIGAGFRGAEHHLSTVGGIETEPGQGTSNLWEALGNTNATVRSPREIYVNARGERYVAEDEPSQDRQERALQAQGGRIWFVFDDAAIDGDEPLVMGWSAEMLREQAAAGEGAWVADAVGELARRAGIDPAGLERTVAEWNAACAAGHDPLGRKALDHAIRTGPFYAVRSEGITVISFGGVTVDRELRVTRTDGEPIPGLYAAGEVIGASATMGDGFCSGMCVTPAISLGRLLGRLLAAQASDTQASAMTAATTAAPR